MESIKADFNAFFGKRFEEICMEFMIKLNTENRLPFKIDYISNWWGSARVKGVRQEIEIDLVALNQKSSQILFTECKWKDNADAGKILKELKEKSWFVGWRKGRRKEYFCIIAKTFKKKIDEKNVLLLDLNDINQAA